MMYFRNIANKNNEHEKYTKAKLAV